MFEIHRHEKGSFNEGKREKKLFIITGTWRKTIRMSFCSMRHCESENKVERWLLDTEGLATEGQGGRNGRGRFCLELTGEPLLDTPVLA